MAALSGIGHLPGGSAAVGWTVGEHAADKSLGTLQFFAGKLKARGTHAGVPHAGLLLHQLDELHKFGHGIHAEEGKKPAVELHGFFRLTAPTATPSTMASSTPTSTARLPPRRARMAVTRRTSVLDSLTAARFRCSRASS